MKPVNLSCAAFPRLEFLDAMVMASRPRQEAWVGDLSLAHTQLCPQNRGVLTEDYARMLRELFPGTRFRLHANVRVLPDRMVKDAVDFARDDPYWQQLATVSRLLDAPAYTLHAGERSHGTLDEAFDNVRRLEDMFGCPVGVEGHYLTKNDCFLLSSWEEHEALLESDVAYVIDLSHIQITAAQSGRIEMELLKALLSSPRCLEVHLSDNGGKKDEHLCLSEHRRPWWIDLLGDIGPNATVFSEGFQNRVH